MGTTTKSYEQIRVSALRLSAIRVWAETQPAETRATVVELADEIVLLTYEKRKVLHGVLAHPEVYGDQGRLLLRACFQAAEEVEALGADAVELANKNGPVASPTQRKRHNRRKV